MAKITVAESAGFCFGVNRAVNKVYELLESGKKVTTLGPIIHNPQMVKELEEKGVSICQTPEECQIDNILVIRSHGVEKSIYDRITSAGLEFEDATCPFVKKIHKIVKAQGEEGRTVLIAGDAAHPEVKGIIGHCVGNRYCFNSSEELEKLNALHPELENSPVCMVSQTTFSEKEWKKCLKIAKKVYTNSNFFDTICDATSKRQGEAEYLADKSDLMIVIGGRSSSNTAKLYELCLKKCPKTYLIETKEELNSEYLQDACNIGVTAGASTPARIIKEVLDTMTDMIKENNASESNFEAMLEENLKNFNTDQKVKGTVISVSPTEVCVDVGRKQTGIVTLEELTDDPTLKTSDICKVGDELELLILRTNDQEGQIFLSKKKIDSIKNWEKVGAAVESKEILSGVVVDINRGGVVVSVDGVRVFVPRSQATLRRNDDIESLLNQRVNLRITEVGDRRRVVGSIREVLAEERKAARDAFWSTIEVGKVYIGTVKSLTSYGAFVDIGGVDGMVHISELSWARIKHPSEVVNVGDTVEVYVKDIDKEKGKISLGYKKQEDNPWEIFKRDYHVGMDVEVRIISLVSFGAFARILPGIDGLIHISQICNRRIEKPADELKVNDVVTARITAIDLENKKISLSIRAIIEEQEAKNAAEAAESDNADVTLSTDEAPAEEAPVVEASAEEVKEPEAVEPETTGEAAE
ncbi:MAG: bifunctional 4-hydroxy-3-methylbut-2-enyl diphosphate reductase/30S ribosomal protein S1 [Clostridiales bacterium]|nr:bifunctional 4-hydroxy-3-methylbut-2-enyl diphosphate reductase/30S ribosomal protein S1 [Clostridiales bacterium]